MTSDPKDSGAEAIPDAFPISVIMQASPSENPWIEMQWEAVGILAGQVGEGAALSEVEIIHDEGDTKHYLFQGFTLRLYTDECESYYHNLISPQPLAYIITTEDEAGRPQPFRVSLSFDEAHAYLEGEDNLYTVPIPPEIYRWSEAFVIRHYVPEKRTKRERQDWRHSQPGSQS
jgi:hypothetical protein